LLQQPLPLISEHCKTLGNTSPSAARAFLDKLNVQLAAMHSFSPLPRIASSATGVLRLINDHPGKKSTDGPLFLLRQMQAKACLAIAFSRVIDRAEPIFVLDAPERNLPKELHNELIDFVRKISMTSQCLYSLADVDIFPKDFVGRRYSAESLEMTVKAPHKE
jgi:hypothetical protein